MVLPCDVLVLDILLEDVDVDIITDVLALFIEALVTAEYPFEEDNILDPTLEQSDAPVVFKPELQSFLCFSKLDESSGFKIFDVVTTVIEVPS